jgi:hypothetical protein
VGVQERPTYRCRVSDSERGRPSRPSPGTGQVAVEVATGVGAAIVVGGRESLLQGEGPQGLERDDGMWTSEHSVHV